MNNIIQYQDDFSLDSDFLNSIQLLFDNSQFNNKKIIIGYASPSKVKGHIDNGDLFYITNLEHKRFVFINSTLDNLSGTLYCNVELNENIVKNLPIFNQFCHAYKVCALWADGEENNTLSVYDFSDESNQRIETDCVNFLIDSFSTIQSVILLKNDFSWESAGHDFWLTRNGHGAGFWDRNLGDLGELLTFKAKKFPEIWLEVGDDNKIYLM